MPRLAYPVMSPVSGVTLDTPEQFLEANYSVAGSQNMEFFDGLLRSRLGLVKLLTDSLGSAVMRLDVFTTLDRAKYFMACTTTDIFELDLAAMKPLYRTPVYTTSTVTVTNGSAIVTGVGTTWAGVAPGDRFRLGTVNAGAFASQVWYTVLTKDSNTQITLTSNYAQANAAGQPYTIRLVFTGGATDYWDSCEFTDTAIGRMWVATNGRDPIHYWPATGQVLPLGGAPPLCKYLLPLLDRLFLGWCVVSGNNEPHQVQWCAPGNAQSWPGVNVEYLVDMPGELAGFAQLGNYAVAVKEAGFYLGRYISAEVTFDFEARDRSHGCLSAWSVVECEGGLYYFGDDLRFHYWDGVQDRSVSDAILPFTRNLDPDGQRYCYGLHLKARKQIRWFVSSGDTPFTHVLVYNYGTTPTGWQIWSYDRPVHLGVPGLVELQTNLFVDDGVWGPRFVDAHFGYWDDRTFLANAPVVIYGGTDGYLRQADSGDTDDGTDILSVFRSTRLDYQLPTHNKRLHQIEPWLKTQGSGTLTYRARRDDRTNFGISKTFSMVESGKDVTKPTAVLDVECHDVTHEFRSTSHFELLGFFTHLSTRRRRTP